MRLRTLPLTLACISLAAFLAVSKGVFSGGIFGFCMLTALLLQILSNLANDYGDAVHGADHHDRQGPLREVQSGNISKSEMKTAIVIAAVLSFVSGMIMLTMAKLSLEEYAVFIILGVLSIVAAVLYTNGKLPYGYVGLGDISVFIFFGLVGVYGSFYLLTGEGDLSILLPASASGLLATAVLNINNIRDIDSDKIAGKKSIPVRLGRASSARYHYLLLFIPVILCAIYVILNYRSGLQFLYLLTLPLLIKNASIVSGNTGAGQLDNALKQMALTTLLFLLLFGLGQILV